MLVARSALGADGVGRTGRGGLLVTGADEKDCKIGFGADGGGGGGIEGMSRGAGADDEGSEGMGGEAGRACFGKGGGISGVGATIRGAGGGGILPMPGKSGGVPET